MIRTTTAVSLLLTLSSTSLAAGFTCEAIKEQPIREACIAERAKPDDVPKVRDPSNIVVHGKPMKQQEFLKKFCSGKMFNETCVAVSRQMSMDATRSKTGAPRV